MLIMRLLVRTLAILRFDTKALYRIGSRIRISLLAEVFMATKFNSKIIR
jgi:hypothetical protein